MSLFIDIAKSCKHYKNNLKIYTQCCDKYYDCPKCHNKNESHVLDIKNINIVKCLSCNTDNNLLNNSNNCINCNMNFGNYKCLECKIWCNKNKSAYHCYKCKSCKIGDINNSYHCDKCNLCLSVSTKYIHKCINLNIEINNICPICLDDINNCKDIILLLKCHHSIHKKCYDELIKHTSSSKIPSCTLCKKSIINPLKYENKFDFMIKKDPMSNYYKNWKSNILCNDCNIKDDVKYHSHYHKCISCSSYNTSVLDVKKLEET